MAAVRDILARKGHVIVALPPAASVLEAAHVMSDRGLGAVLVLEEGRLVGIFTERDVLRRVVADGRDPAATPLGTVMTTSRISSPMTRSAPLFSARRISADTRAGVSSWPPTA